MVHANVFRCALLSLKPGTIHGILQLKAEVDQVIKYAINYSTYQHVFCMYGGVRPNVNSAMPTYTHIAVQTKKCAIPVQQKSSFCALKSCLLFATKHILCQFTVIHWRIEILLHVLSICRTTRVAYAPIARRFVNQYRVCEKWSFCHGFIKTEMNSSLYGS